MTEDNQPWRWAAQALGFSLHAPVGAYGGGTSFAQLDRMLGPPVMGPTNTTHWMRGRVHVAAARRDVDVIVLTNIVSSDETTTLFTHALARIDPPLLMGLKIEPVSPLDHLFGRRMNETGDGEFDRAFKVNALMPREAHRLVKRLALPPNDVVDHLHALRGRWSVLVSDSVVDLWSMKTADPADLGPRTAAAAALAALIASRRAPIPRDPDEGARLRIWDAFAAAERLELDPTRFLASGPVGGLAVRMGLEGEWGQLLTTLVADLPQALGLGLQITKQPSLQFLATLFGAQDIRVGDSAFDDAFVVKARDPARVRALFDRAPAARRALVELAYYSKELMFDDGRLIVRWPTLQGDQGRLHGVVHRVRVVGDAVAPVAGGLGPYR